MVLGQQQMGKTKQHTPEIRSLRCYLPEPLGPVSQLLPVYGFGEGAPKWRGPAVQGLCLGEQLNRTETHEQLTRGQAHHNRLIDSFSSRF